LSKNIGIIGGGLLGMALSLRLIEQGFKVTLIEANDRLGSLASPSRIGRFTGDQFSSEARLGNSKILEAHCKIKAINDIWKVNIVENLE